jgi:retron-type reverse transcriptase
VEARSKQQGQSWLDGMTIDAAKDYLRDHWPNIRAQLLEGTYQPQPVKRVEIRTAGSENSGCLASSTD